MQSKIVKNFLTASAIVTIGVSAFFLAGTAFASDECGQGVCSTNSNNNVHVENNNNNDNVNENHQVVRIERPAPEVVTVTEGGTPVYEEVVEIYETPPTGPEALSVLAFIPSGLAGIFLRRNLA